MKTKILIVNLGALLLSSFISFAQKSEFLDFNNLYFGF